MAARWFHAPSIPPEGEALELDPREGHHATRARHLESGEEIVLSDGAGTTARAILSEGGRRSATAVVVERTLHPEPARRLHLASALPKGDRLATLLSMATQLGMTDFTPLAARRSVVQPSEATPDRWLRIAREACKQSRRPWQPVFHPPSSPVESVKAATESIVALMDSEGEPMASLLGEKPPHRLLLVGPEGGFDENEIADMASSGARRFALADATLRIETAATAALAVLAQET